MSDNITITQGSGTTVKTDDAGSAHYQVIKLADGTADATAVIAADIGVKANALRTAPASNITDGTYIGDIKFGEALPAGTAEIGKLAAGTATIGKLASNSGVDIGDVTLNAGTAEIGKLAAGTATIGKLATNSGVDIGDVDVASLPGELSGPGTPVIESYAHVAINLTTGADQVLVASSANKQIWVYGYGFTCGDADGQSVSFQDEDNAAVTGIMEFAQYGGISVAPSGNFAMPVHKLATNKDLEVDILGGDVDGWIAYAIVDVS